MYTLYTIPGSCSTGIHTLLNALNIPVKIINRDDVENYQEIVPTNQVPALKDGELLLTEGAAIAQYLMEKHHVDTRVLGGTTAFNQWLMFCYSTLHPAYSKLFTALRTMPEGEGKSFTTGEQPAVVDYLMAIYANWGNAFPDLTIKLGDNVIRLIDRVKTLPEFVQAFETEGANHAIPLNSH